MSSFSADPPFDEDVTSEAPSKIAQEQSEPPMSKNKLKKILRDQKWEEGRERRKELRKVKAKEKKERKRAAQNTHAPSDFTSEKRKASAEPEAPAAKKSKTSKPVQLPVSFVIDCNFDDLMRDHERTSLASQITRSYSENHKAPFKSYLFVSSFGGLLKQRFDTVLAGHHHNWKGVKFLEGDFKAAASEAADMMKTDRRGRLAGAFQKPEDDEDAEAKSISGETVYLTSDSPETLTELRPYSTYIIGGIVDKNRHKGICYKRAMDQGVRTAKLPIGDYMQMTSRFVLATNHVVEIMLRWLEVGDWAKALVEVIPPRKGGVLKDGMTAPGQDPERATHNEEADLEATEKDQEEEDQEENAIQGNDVDKLGVTEPAAEAPGQGEEHLP
ncbi:MAG: hypothetical protein LQ339_003405 [Xanthoria mediterranea]|nr:MAG: hypothetical protein LQ339_003405 [Xanthoria mediterranea]